MGLFDALLSIVQALCGGKTREDEQDKPQAHPPHPQQQHQQHQQPVAYPPSHQQQQQHQPSHPQQRPPKRYGDNEANQQNAHYKGLRDRARHEGDAMARCFRESQEAYQSGNGARAKELSNEGKQHQAEMERLNDEASAWIYRENNLDSGPDEIDLHGLYVKEAIEQTEKGIISAQGRGDSEVRLIVGKGLHSPQHVAKLKPAIENLIVKHGLSASIDPHNAGVLVVALNGHGQGRGMDAGEITRRLERDDEQCTIM